MSQDTGRLVDVARRQLLDIGVSLGEREFVCHLCLRKLPTSKATTGHYPSRAAGGGQYALQCDDCNSRLGFEIERDAARFLASNEWEMTVGPPGTAGVRMNVLLETAGPILDLKDKSAANKWGLIRYLAMRASRPDVLECVMKRPHQDALRMAILAWSFSEWSNYSGYAYTASVGAQFVRRAILDGSYEIPESAVVFYDQDLVPPLQEPDPVLVVQADNDIRSLGDVDEFLGLGVFWSERVVGILPAGSDADGSVYRRLVDLRSEGKQIRYLPITAMMAEIGVDSLSKVMVVSDRSEWEMRLTDWIDPSDRAAWGRDAFPRRLEPSLGSRRKYPPGVVQKFYMVEDTLDPSIDRALPTPPKGRRKNLRERRVVIAHTAVRGAPLEDWHVATHVWFVNEKPTTFAVYCGAAVQSTSTQRPVSEIGRLGVGFLCDRCRQIMAIKPAALRRPARRRLPKS